jgi:hypothetical protein
MNKPHIPQSPVPMLTEVVQVNGSLRPAVFPWAPQAPKFPPVPAASAAPSLAPQEEQLADKVIARVQAQLALILPEMMRNAVDEVLNEHLNEVNQSTPPTPPA